MNSSFINDLALHIKEKYDLKQEELTVVFPNKRAAFYLRSKFQEIYKEEIWLPQMLSIQEAMTQWSGIQLVDSVDMLFELISIDSEIYGKGDNIGIFGSMATQMAKDFDEIDQYNVDAKHLFSYVYETKQIGEWHLDSPITEKEQQHLEFFKNLEQYYDRLRQRLEQHGKGYYGMITRHLASLDDERLLDCTNCRKIVFAGFNALTPTEQIVIDKLYRNGFAEVIWDFDRYYVEDENNEAGRFARSYMEKNRPWKPTVFSNDLLTQNKEIYFVNAEGNSVQTKALQSLLQVEVNDNIAIILADEELLVPTLNSIPDETRYGSLKVSMGYPLHLTSLSHLINAYFSLHRKGRKVSNGNWYLWPILRIFDLEMVHVIFNDQEMAELNQYRSFVAEKSAFVFNNDDFECYCKSPNLRQFVELLLSESANSPTSLLNALVKFLAFIANQVQITVTSGSSHFLLNQVSEAGRSVNRLNDIINRYKGYANTIEDLEVLFRLVSRNTSIKLNNSTTDGLQLMGLLEARNLDFSTIYMVGVNEGVLPAESSHNSFIPYNIRKECGLPDEHDKQAVYAYHFYRLLQGAQKAYFIYNSSSDRSGGEPSRFLLQLKYELSSRNPGLVIHEESFTPPTVSTDPPEHIVIHKTEALMETLMQKIQTTMWKKALAPTSISTYIKCPLLFCFKHLMNIRDNSADEDTPANKIGTAVHDTLQHLYHDYCGVPITPQLFEKEIEPSMQNKLNQAFAKTFVHGLPNVGFNYLNQLTLNQLFKNWVAYEKADIAKHQLSIVALEELLHTSIEVDGITCAIAGTADRIDLHDGIVRVIDYKTGQVKENDVRVPKEVNSVHDIPEKAMQLLIYKYLYLKAHPKQDPAKVTASIYALRQRQVGVELKVDYAPLNEAFMATMEAFLTGILSSMMDTSIHFVQPDASNDTPCYFCDFKDICVSTSAGAKLEDGR